MRCDDMNKWKESMKKYITNFIKRCSWLKIEIIKVKDIGIKIIKTKNIFKIKH